MSTTSSVRVRFAPSPTGYLHVGGARTALFNWLFARHQQGKLLLRIEDTDEARNTAPALAVIYEGLRWLGIDWDEGPNAPGDHGPYLQSQRKEIYERYFEQLKAAGHLYEDGGAWRFKFERGIVEVDDLICGRVSFDFGNVEINPDLTIRRADGSFIFHFVNVVDDLEMQITHVIRGEDHLSNTPKHLQLFKALGAEPPRYGHIPLILNKDGSKMSKRDQGASVASYMEGGYAPEAVANYLCLLGWSPKDDREKMELAEIVSIFDLANINRKSAHFDLDKCNWLNAQYLAHMPAARYADLARPFLERAGVTWNSDEELLPVLALVREKVKFLTELPGWIGYFFTEDYQFDDDAVEETLRKAGALDRLEQLATAYTATTPWEAATLEARLKEVAAEQQVKPAAFIHPARVAVSGKSIGPSLYHMLEVMGRDRVLRRFRETVQRLR